MRHLMLLVSLCFVVSGQVSGSVVEHADLWWTREAPTASYTWDGANNYCSSLTLRGFDDWRLPTIDEMEEARPGKGCCYPEGIRVPMVTFGFGDIWSSETRGSVAYHYDFARDDVGRSGKGYQNFVLCVRDAAGEPVPEPPPFVKLKKLMWANIMTDAEGFDWYQASKYCADMDRRGFTDWRLPELKELAKLYGSSIRVRTKVRYGIEMQRFSASWSARADSRKASIFNFKTGEKYHIEKERKGLGTLCVRSVRPGDGTAAL